MSEPIEYAWLVRGENDDIRPFTCGIATTDTIADKIIDKLKRNFSEDCEYIASKIRLDGVAINDGLVKFITCNNPHGLVEKHGCLYIVEAQNDETYSFICGIATTNDNANDIIRIIDTVFTGCKPTDPEFEPIFEYDTQPIMLDVVNINGESYMFD